MSSTQNPNTQQLYEDYKPKMEEQDTPEALLFLVHLPGFTRQQVGANHEAAYRRIRVFGEKPIENNKRQRCSVEYIIPEYCDAGKLKGEFQEGAIITITMPKNYIPIHTIAPEEPEPAQEPEADKQVSTPPPPPKSASEVESASKAGAMKNGEKGVSEEKPKSKMESSQKDETPTPPEVTKESEMPQKDTQQEDQKNHEREKMKESTGDSSSITEKEKGSESGIPTKDQEEGKGTPQEEDEKKKKTSEAGKASQQKDQYLVREKSKELERKESDDVGLKKTPEKREKEELFQKGQRVEIEKSKEKRKESAAERPDIGLKKTSEKKEEEKQIMDAEPDKVNNQERNRHGNDRVSDQPSSMGKGMMIKDMDNSASQVTRLVNRFNEEDKQKKLLCAGVAILVVAVGIYASFKLRSMTRQ